ncbi:hypothetical protein HBA53_24670 (plasmid) [Rhodococcus pyridinivorans]|uniref:DUF5677 domain-containing protein n=1 Tax=Rhodococcus pyridinivorans TaxID=103816 RepID=UPI001C2FC925|nr:DUF5677 domain-containing protein [Rhodococcus pyridinivorans]QXF84302.1 hypothetical protein HBA53_24670 [Rhodococcus pyridinivorans]
MSKPDETALEAWIDQCVAHLRDAEDFDVHRPHKDEFLLLYGVAVRVMRYSDAYLRLVRCGFVGEAVVLARTALEHAVTLQWVFIVNGGINRFQVDVGHDRLEHYRNLAVWLDHHELAEAVASLDSPPEGKRLPPFMNMLRELDQEKFLETSYHILSQHVHVTHAAVAQFLEQGTEELHIKYEPKYGYQYQATYVVAVSCMLARWVVAMLTDDPPLLELLDKTSDDLILPMTLIDNVEEKKRRKGLSEAGAVKAILLATDVPAAVRLAPDHSLIGPNFHPFATARARRGLSE